jgi:hypothetical protein
MAVTGQRRTRPLVSLRYLSACPGLAAFEVETGANRAILAITLDRCSNGPHVYYPNPLGPGGKGESEDWVWDNFNYDPHAKNSMLQNDIYFCEQLDLKPEAINHYGRPWFLVIRKGPPECASSLS